MNKLYKNGYRGLSGGTSWNGFPACMIIGKPGQDHSMIADEVLQLAGELGLIKYISCDSNYFYDFSKKGWKVIKRAYSEHFAKYDKP